MLRNCAAILFVCFDMTACDTLSLFSRRSGALDYEMPADREGNHGKQAKQFALNSVAIVR